MTELYIENKYWEQEIKPYNEQSLPNWIVELEEEQIIRNELKTIINEVDNERAIYLRLKAIYDTGLTNTESNKAFQHFSGSSMTK